MKCDRARELASEELDGALATDASGALERHLTDCPPCRTFFAELRESLLLLEDLPVLEVGDEFNAAVWARIRAEEAPQSVWAGWRARLASFGEQFGMMTPAWKWSPVGVAAALVLFFALTSGPSPSGWNGASDAPMASATEDAAAAVPMGPSPAPVESTFRRGAPNAAEGPTLLATGSPASGGTAVTTDDEVGDIPEAIERFLQRSESRELLLEGGSDRYRQANYSYPLRRIPDPSRSGSVGSVPVSGQRFFGPRRPDPTPRGAILPVVQPVSAGAEVIAF